MSRWGSRDPGSGSAQRGSLGLHRDLTDPTLCQSWTTGKCETASTARTLAPQGSSPDVITATGKERSAGSPGARGGKRADPGRAEGAAEEGKEQRPDGVGRDSRKNAGCKTEIVPAPHSRAAERVNWGDEQRGELAWSLEEPCTGWALSLGRWLPAGLPMTTAILTRFSV